MTHQAFIGYHGNSQQSGHSGETQTDIKPRCSARLHGGTAVSDFGFVLGADVLQQRKVQGCQRAPPELEGVVLAVVGLAAVIVLSVDKDRSN